MKQNILDNCKTCKHYTTTSKLINSEKMEVIGHYCRKFMWNLSKINHIPDICKYRGDMK